MNKQQIYDNYAKAHNLTDELTLEQKAQALHDWYIQHGRNPHENPLVLATTNRKERRRRQAEARKKRKGG